MDKIKEYYTSGFWLMLVMFTVSAGQAVGMQMPLLSTIPIGICMVLFCVLALIIKDLTPQSWGFPAFAIAMLLGAIVSSGDTALARWVEQEAKTVNFLATTTPLLAFAGLSMVNQIEELKTLSWKIAIIAVVVFTSIFFICALIANIVMKMQGVL